MADKTLHELAARLSAVMDEQDALAKQKSDLWKEYEELRKVLIPDAMEAAGLDVASVSDVGRISLKSDVYASIPAQTKEKAYGWLAEHGHGGLIKDTVNASTFKAWCKEMYRKGEVIPDDVFTVTPFTVASLTRSK